MQLNWKSIAATMAMTALLAAAGCGGDEKSSAPPAAIPGNESAQTPNNTQSPNTTPTQPKADPKHPVVVIDTSPGRITVELDADKAPFSVKNFLSYVDSGHYDQTIFHQVFSDHPKLAIAGGYTADRKEKPTTFAVFNEARNGLKNTRGTIAMARSPDVTGSAKSQFFLNLSDNDMLDYKGEQPEDYGYAVFGKVTAGLDVAEKIANAKVHDVENFLKTPIEQIIIRSIRRAG